jgi:hypothetical protein
MKRETLLILRTSAFTGAIVATVLGANCSRAPEPTGAARPVDAGAAAEPEPPARQKITCEGKAKPVLTLERDDHLVAVTCPDGARQAVLCKGRVRRSRLFDDGRFYVECPEDVARGRQ